MENLLHHFMMAGLAFGICVILTPLFAKAAKRFGWVAVPREDRWHKNTTALLGGVAIYCAVGLPLFWLADPISLFQSIHMQRGPDSLPSASSVLWFGLTCLFILGLVDDFFHLTPQHKLVVEIVVASLVTFWGYRLNWSQSLTADTMITIVWIVGITNAMNLLDNMDGLCAGISAIGALVFSYIHFNEGSPEMATMGLLLAGALVAFLIYNFNPASVFMGDCGSLPIGFGLAVLCLHPANGPIRMTVPLYAVPVLVLLVPIFDTTMVTLIRLLSGRKASTGGQDHTSHRLVLMGLSEKGAVLFLYGTAFLSGLAAVFVQEHDSLAAPTVILPLVLSLVLMGVYLAQIRVYPEKEFSVLRNGRFTPILMEITYRRQLFHVVLDLVLVSFAYYLAFRFTVQHSENFFNLFAIFLQTLPAVIICKYIAFFLAGVYRGIWRYIALSDIFVYLKATVLATLISLAVVTYVHRFGSLPKGIFLIDWFLTAAFLVGSRLSFRVFVEIRRRKTIKGKNVLIYGAGQGGQVLLREMLDNGHLGVKPVGFVDDDLNKVGKRLQGFPVYGTGEQLSSILGQVSVNGLVVSCRSLADENNRRLKGICQQKGLFLKRFVVNLEDVDIEKG